MKKIAIIGGGPAGLTAALKLSEAGVRVHLYEAGSKVGGMAKSVELWGQIVDIGPHRFFSSDPRVNKVWLDAVGDEYEMVQRTTRIFYNNRFFHYPLKPLNAVAGLGIFKSISCVLSFFWSKFFPQNPDTTFESWVTNRFGSKLFNIFFRSYSEKLWGISCKDLDSDFAAQRIKKLSLYEAVLAAFTLNKKKHKTLVDEFAYPALGAGLPYENMHRQIIKNGGKVFLSTKVQKVLPGRKAKVVFDSGKSAEFDHVISSMPITDLVTYMNPPSHVLHHARKLRFRNTILVYLELIPEATPFPDQWIYVHSPNLKTGRVTNFKNWVRSINKNCENTIICLEYWCYDNDPIWNDRDEQLVALATSEICETGLVQPTQVIQGKVFRVPKCYPVYATGYKKHIKPVEAFLNSVENVSAIGRYGSFKYNNQDHSILMGLLVAENLIEGKQNNLWEINTDYEYQEASKITASGLSKG